MINKLFKQYNLKWIGSFINVFYMSLPIFGVATNIMEAGTFYGVQKENIHHLMPWMSFQLFLALIIILGLGLLLIFYKFIYPSYYKFLNEQTYKHENPMQKDLALIKKHLGIKDEDNK